MTAINLKQFYEKYSDLGQVCDSLPQPETDFVVDVYFLASHVSSLNHYIMGVDEVAKEEGAFTEEKFNEHWEYSFMLLRLTRAIFNYLHPRKLKDGYEPLDQEVLTFVRNSCVDIGAFRHELLQRWNKQTLAQKLTGKSLQMRFSGIIGECIGHAAVLDKDERDARFLEEAFELMQARGRTKEEINKILDSVYAKPVGEMPQEIAGTLLTLYALGTAHNLDVQELGEQEYVRVLNNVEKVRSKQKTKTHF